MDLQHMRTVSTVAAQEYAKANKLMFIETSALDNCGIPILFESITNGNKK